MEVATTGGGVTSVVAAGVDAGSTAGVWSGELPLIPAEICGPTCAAVSFWHPAIEEPPRKTTLRVAKEASILRASKREIIGGMPAFR
jgi:hypothetical protein